MREILQHVAHTIVLPSPFKFCLIVLWCRHIPPYDLCHADGIAEIDRERERERERESPYYYCDVFYVTYYIVSLGELAGGELWVVSSLSILVDP